MRGFKSILVSLLLSMTTTGCGVETILHGLTEREANQVLELLADHDIQAQKLMVESGRDTVFNISVSPGTKIDAIKLLNQNEMPRRKDRGYAEVFKDAGLIPTSSEEKARKLAALEGEIEKQLKLVDGILDAQVQIVLPDDKPLRTGEEERTPTTASVAVRYLPDSTGHKPLNEEQLKTLVAAGVEGLTPGKVVPLMTPIRTRNTAPLPTEFEGDQVTFEPSGSWLAQFSTKHVNMITTATILLIVILCVLLVAWQIRLKRVRTMLVRLQTQVTEARQRQAQAESLPPPSSS